MDLKTMVAFEILLFFIVVADVSTGNVEKIKHKSVKKLLDSATTKNHTEKMLQETSRAL